VDWGELDFLIVDTPPGTSDEHLSIVQYLKGAGIDGALIVSTPQEVAMADVRKEINFCKKTKVGSMSGRMGVQNRGGKRKFVLQSCLFASDLCSDIFPLLLYAIKGFSSSFVKRSFSHVTAVRMWCVCTFAGSSHDPQVNVLGVVENMSGLRCPVNATQFLDASGQDVTAATIATLTSKCPEILSLMMATEVKREGGH
jgi:hypothetical protein